MFEFGRRKKEILILTNNALSVRQTIQKSFFFLETLFLILKSLFIVFHTQVCLLHPSYKNFDPSVGTYLIHSTVHHIYDEHVSKGKPGITEIELPR
jgi:hypothetical protein